jgi:hypothetical protein
MTTEFKWQRMKGGDTPQIGQDQGGMYFRQGSIGFAFGAEAQNQFITFGVWKALQPAVHTAQGLTPYLENIWTNPQWITLLMHLQRNPNGATIINPRARFWVNGQPVRQRAGAVYDLGNLITGALWSDPDPADPDYGSQAPSWVTATTRGHSEKIRYCEINGTLNKNNSGIGGFNIDDEHISSLPLAPT